MAAAITDLLTQATVNSRPSPTQVTTTRVGGGTTLQCNALTGWPTGTAVHFITYKIDTSGNKIAGSQIDMKGVVSGTNLTLVVIKAGTDVGNAIGDIVEAAPTAAWANDLYSWGSAHANQDGSLITAAVQAALGLSTLNGYTPVGFAPSSVTYSGNRTYSLLFTGQNLTTFLSSGIRLRTTRTVAAPTQCTSLNGTTQFYSKSSPAGMTFTNFPVHGWWIKLASYNGAIQTIASRYNGTSGHTFTVNTSGQLVLTGFNAGAANFNSVTSYQAVPLNRWVHVAAELDMSTATLDGTHSWVMIDGVDVLAFKTSGGTNPTALVQAGNWEVGSQNGGLLPLNGKIANGGVFSAAVTEATLRGYMSQSLAGTETSLVSAYSFNNTINDLNGTNANNLTANGAATATNADSPFGGQADGTISSVLDYGEIVSATFSTNTTVVVRTTDLNTIPTSGGITSVVYSSNAYPYAFPGITSTIGQANVAVPFSTASATAVQVSGLSAPITIPTGGRRVRATVAVRDIYNNTAGDYAVLSLWDGVVNSGTLMAEGQWLANAINQTVPAVIVFEGLVAGGAKTYNVGLKQITGGTATLEATIGGQASLIVDVL